MSDKIDVQNENFSWNKPPEKKAAKYSELLKALESLEISESIEVHPTDGSQRAGIRTAIYTEAMRLGCKFKINKTTGLSMLVTKEQAKNIGEEKPFTFKRV